MYLRLSKAVSVVLHPFLVPLYMVLLLLLAGTVYSLYPLKVKIIPYLGDVAFYDDHSGFGDRTAQVVS